MDGGLKVHIPDPLVESRQIPTVDKNLTAPQWSLRSPCWLKQSRCYGVQAIPVLRCQQAAVPVLRCPSSPGVTVPASIAPSFSVPPCSIRRQTLQSCKELHKPRRRRRKRAKTQKGLSYTSTQHVVSSCTARGKIAMKHFLHSDTGHIGGEGVNTGMEHRGKGGSGSCTGHAGKGLNTGSEHTGGLGERQGHKTLAWITRTRARAARAPAWAAACTLARRSPRLKARAWDLARGTSTRSHRVRSSNGQSSTNEPRRSGNSGLNPRARNVRRNKKSSLPPKPKELQ